MSLAWQDAIAHIDFSSRKNSFVWHLIFQPENTTWGLGSGSRSSQDSVYRSKAEALEVLFVGHQSFNVVGISVLKEFVEWCDKFAFKYTIDSPAKVKAYLEYRIANAIERWENDALDSNGNGKRTTVKEECAMNSFRSAMTHLDAVARWQGFSFAMPSLIDTEEICVLKERLSTEQSRARAAVQDYAASSRFITKRLTTTERNSMVQCWWEGSASACEAKTVLGQEWAQLRGLLMYCLQNSIGRRSADLRNIRLSMLFTHALPSTSPVKSCPVIGASLRHVKECNDNVEHLLGWIRARNRYECPLGALACYMVYMNDIEGPPILDIIRNELELGQHHSQQQTRQVPIKPITNTWHSIMLIQGRNGGSNSDIKTPICYTTHNVTTHAGMDAAGVTNKTTSTHIFRNSLACELIEKGTGIEDVGLYMGWYHNTAADRYLRGAFKTDPMMVSHGWDSKDSFECWWEDGDNPAIPHDLTSCVFPGLDDLYAELHGTQYKDCSAIEFLKCMKLLRRIYIEDAVVKRDKYPDFPAYKRHPLFDSTHAIRMTSWLQFKEAQIGRTLKAPTRIFEEKQKIIIDAMKLAVAEVMGCQKDDSASSHSSHFRRTSNVLAKPTEEERMPDIKEPVDLYTCYQEWVVNARGYFRRVVRPPWKAQHGERALALRLRYCRVKPYFEYLDLHSDDQPIKARPIIDKLDAIRKEYNIAPAAFIKQCFYSWKHGIAKDAKKQPPILPDIFHKAIEARGLPTFQ